MFRMAEAPKGPKKDIVGGGEEEKRALLSKGLDRGDCAGQATWHMVVYQSSWTRCVNDRAAFLPVTSQRIMKIIFKLSF